MKMPEGQNCVAGIWEPPAGARIRIAFGTSPDTMRAILWAQVSKDGSLYLGPRNPKLDIVQMGRKEILPEGTFFKYGEGEKVTDKRFLKEKKLSFHASGAVHAGGKRSFIQSFRDIKERTLICHILPESPDKIPFLEKIKKYDICTNYPIDDSRPLSCNVYVSPISKGLPPVEILDAQFQFSVLLKYENLTDVGDFIVQFLFFHSKQAPWPPATYIVWKASPDY